MASRPDRAIQFLKKQLAKRSARGAVDVFPVASPSDIRSAERKLGFELPQLLKRVYLEIGNGGRKLGPGFGLFGLPGGYDNQDGRNIVKATQEMAADYGWWEQAVVICDWGCAMLSCVDCGDSDFPVYRWDGNFFDAKKDLDEPSEEVWQIEADSFEEWLTKPNCP